MFQLKRYTTYVGVLTTPVQAEFQSDFHNDDIPDESKLINLQPHNITESNVNYYHHQQSPHEQVNSSQPINRYGNQRTNYRSGMVAPSVGNVDDHNEFEIANF